jgi:hypothetical protein
VLAIPNADAASPSQLTTAFDTDFANLFTDAPILDDIANLPPTPMTASAPVAAPSAQTARPVPSNVVTAAQAIDRLPSLDALPRPVGLLTSTAPYIMTVTANGKDWMRIDCSHEPSLELLASYLKKWTKAITNDSERVCLFSI